MYTVCDYVVLFQHVSCQLSNDDSTICKYVQVAENMENDHQLERLQGI